MTIPQHVLSSTTISGTYVHGDTVDFDPLDDYEPGGVALNDASEGLFGVTWRLRCTDGHALLISALPSVAETTLFTRPGTVTELSLAFDQNMRPTVAFVEDGEAYLYWYDSVEEDHVFTNYGATVLNPRVTLDDKRDMQTGTSDVVFAYIKNNHLYTREQRDRYEEEYLMATNLDRSLRKVSMNNVLRLQFELGPVTV